MKPQNWTIVFREKHGDYVWMRKGLANEYALSDGTYPEECEDGPYLIDMVSIRDGSIQINIDPRDPFHVTVDLPSTVSLRCSLRVALWLINRARTRLDEPTFTIVSKQSESLESVELYLKGA